MAMKTYSIEVNGVQARTLMPNNIGHGNTRNIVIDSDIFLLSNKGQVLCTPNEELLYHKIQG